MKEIKEVEGNLFQLTREGKFDVIGHGVNCFCTMGSGIAVPMKNEFGVDRFPLEDVKYKGDINKLGQIDFAQRFLEDGRWVAYPDEGGLWVTEKVIVVNAYTQYDYNRNKDPEAVHLDYEALAMCLKKINHKFKGKRIGLPLIGCGRAGGNWSRVRAYIQQYLMDMDVTIVHFKD